MVDPDHVEEQELTPEEVMDAAFEEPQQEVEWVPEWDEYPEERPGENTHIEDETLIWERDGFEARLESWETTHWRAEIDIPEEVGEQFVRPVDLKCRPVPEYGFVEAAEIEDYVATGATIVIAENYQPVYEVNKFIDHLLEKAEKAREFMQQVEAAQEAARQNAE